MYFIDGDDICERKPFHIYEAVEYFKDMSVRSMKTAGNGGADSERLLEAKTISMFAALVIRRFLLTKWNSSLAS